KHNDNAAGVVDYLKNHPGVNWINYPGLKENPTHDFANKYFKKDLGHGSVITFGIKGGLEAGRKLIDNIKLWSHVANVGEANALIIHTASSTHQRLDLEGLKKSRRNVDLVRLAVGIEDLDDMLYYIYEAIFYAKYEASQIEDKTNDAIKWLFKTTFD